MPAFKVRGDVFFGMLGAIAFVGLSCACTDSEDVPPVATPTAGSDFTAAQMVGGETVEVWVYKDTQQDGEFCSDIIDLMVPADVTASIPGKPASCTVKGPESLHLIVVKDGNDVLHLSGIKLVLLGENELPTRPPSDSGWRCAALEANLLSETDDPSAATWQAECQLQVPAKGAPQSSSRVVWASVPADTEVPPGQTLPCWLMPKQMQGPGGAKFVRCFL